MAKSSRQALAQGAQSDFDDLFGARLGERIVSAGFKMLAHDRIIVRPQVRLTFPQNELDELRASIRALRAEHRGIEGTGLLQALLVSLHDSKYHLIVGEKRFRAAQAEGLPEVPCVIVPAASEGMTRLLQLTENALRSAPPVLEEALAIHETMQQQKLSQRDLARLLGKNRGYIENRVRLLKMDSELQDMVVQRPDTLKHAQLIAGVKNTLLRGELIRAVVEEEASVKELERRLQTALIGTASARSQAHPQPQSPTKVPSRDGTLSDAGQTIRVDPAPAAPIILPSRDGSEAADQPLAERPGAPDLIADLLLPAVSLLEEAQRHLVSTSLTSSQRDDVLSQVETLDEHLMRIKISLHRTDVYR